MCLNLIRKLALLAALVIERPNVGERKIKDKNKMGIVQIFCVM